MHMDADAELPTTSLEEGWCGEECKEGVQKRPAGLLLSKVVAVASP